MLAPNGVAMQPINNVRRSPFMVRSTVPSSAAKSRQNSRASFQHQLPRENSSASSSSSSSSATIPKSWTAPPQRQQPFLHGFDAMDSARQSARESPAPRHRSMQRSASVGSIGAGSMHPQDSVHCVLQRTFSAEALSPRHNARSNIERFRSAPTPRLTKQAFESSCAENTTKQPDSDIMVSLAALYVEMQSLSTKTDSVANQLEDCRIELRRYSDDLCSGLEERLKIQIVAIEERLKTQIVEMQDQLNSKTQMNRADQSPLFSKSGNVKLDDSALSLNLAVCAGVPPSKHANLVKDISDHVIARVNADPHICQLVENHQSIQENFTKLLGLVGSIPALGQGDQADALALYDTMIETQTTCKSVASELHQLQQRRNQDTYEAAMRFADLERKLQALESNLTSESVLKLCLSSSDGFSNISELLLEAHAEQDARTPVAIREEGSGRKSAELETSENTSVGAM